MSRDLIKRALIVLRRGVESLATAVDHDLLDVTTAARVARLDADVQQAVVSARDPKAAAFRAFRQFPAPPTPSHCFPLVPDGNAFIRIAPDTPTVGALKLADGGNIPGIPKPLADGRVWLGWYIDVRRGLRMAYLIPRLRGGWFVVVMNLGTDELLTREWARKPWAAMALLTALDGFGFDANAAYWQPTERFAPSDNNPLFTDTESAPTLSGDLKRSIVNETCQKAERNVNTTNTPDESEDTYRDIEL